MPNPVPVPSKGALRALRKLALGTSCTIAFSAGLLTEDRRRRIHSAREVHDNAKKLRSSRQYHSAGTSSLETFEEQAGRYRDESFWLPSNVAKSTAVAPIDSVIVPSFLEKPAATSLSAPRNSENARPPSRTTWKPFLEARPSPRAPLRTNATRETKTRKHREQHRLALDVMKILGDGPPDVNGAAHRFFDAFEEGLPREEGLIQPLLDAALELTRACQRQKSFETSSKVLQILISHGPIAEDQYLEFNPDEAISHLLARQPGGEGFNDPATLSKACSIFLADFREKPGPLSDKMLRLGERLCRESCHLGMFDLCLGVYQRLDRCRGSRPPLAVEYLITATHGKGHHKKMYRCFKKFYAQTTPDQLSFYNVTRLTLDSMFLLGDMDKAEQVLLTAKEIAERAGLHISTTSFLQLLGREWRSHGDIIRTQALFKRIQPLLHVVNHPDALYGSIIQYCVEARENDLATFYSSELHQNYGPSHADAAICGHFALAKAYQKDWNGVQDEFLKMKALNPINHDTRSASFTPILVEFLKTHSLEETEEFLGSFIASVRLRMTSYIMNIMVNAYSKVRELDAISRWIGYAAADGCAVNAATFNAIFMNCAHAFRFSFMEMFHLYEKVRNLGPQYVDDRTVAILRQSAVRDSPSACETQKRLKALKSLDKAERLLPGAGTLRAMTMTLAKDNPAATLKIYNRALKNHAQLGSRHLVIAVRAALLVCGQNIDEPARLIRNAQESSRDITQAVTVVFIHQMSNLLDADRSETGAIAQLVYTTVSAFEETGLEVPQAVLAHTASTLQRQGHDRWAIDLWDSMSRRLKISPSSFDLVSLTTLLKAYLQLQDAPGLRWVMNTLSANKLTPDPQFRLLLKNARRNISRHIDSNDCSDRVHRFLDAVLEAIHQTKEMRAHISHDKHQVNIKMLKIMETAIEDQAARDKFEKGDKELNFADDTQVLWSKNGPFQKDQLWIGSQKDHAVQNFPPSRLVGAVGG